MILVIDKPNKSRKFINLSRFESWRLIVDSKEASQGRIVRKYCVRIELRCGNEEVTKKIFTLRSKKEKAMHSLWHKVKNSEASVLEVVGISLEGLESFAGELNELIRERAWEAATAVEVKLLEALADQSQPMCIIDWGAFLKVTDNLKEQFSVKNEQIDQMSMALGLLEWKAKEEAATP